MATAHLARAVCKYTAFAHDYAFTCGLLHDVGIAAVLLLLGDTRRGAEPPELAHVWPALFNVHQRASGWLCTRWKLPPDVVAVVSNHHDFTIEGRVHPLAAAVALAEALATRLGHGVGREIPEGQEQRAAAALGLSDAQLGLVMAEGELLRHYVSASASE
jgi:HD-like signal output (HDOD) protein